MLAGFLSHPKRQFYPSGIHFTFIMKIPGETFSNENTSRITLHGTDIYRN